MQRARVARRIAYLAYGRPQVYERLVEITRAIGVLDESACSSPEDIECLLGLRRRMERQDAAENSMDVPVKLLGGLRARRHVSVIITARNMYVGRGRWTHGPVG